MAPRGVAGTAGVQVRPVGVEVVLAVVVGCLVRRTGLAARNGVAGDAGVRRRSLPANREVVRAVTAVAPDRARHRGQRAALEVLIGGVLGACDEVAGRAAVVGRRGGGALGAEHAGVGVGGRVSRRRVRRHRHHAATGVARGVGAVLRRRELRGTVAGQAVGGEVGANGARAHERCVLRARSVGVIVNHAEVVAVTVDALLDRRDAGHRVRGLLELVRRLERGGLGGVGGVVVATRGARDAVPRAGVVVLGGGELRARVRRIDRVAALADAARGGLGAGATMLVDHLLVVALVAREAGVGATHERGGRRLVREGGAVRGGLVGVTAVALGSHRRGKVAVGEDRVDEHEGAARLGTALAQYHDLHGVRRVGQALLAEQDLLVLGGRIVLVDRRLVDAVEVDIRLTVVRILGADELERVSREGAGERVSDLVGEARLLAAVHLAQVRLPGGRGSREKVRLGRNGDAGRGAGDVVTAGGGALVGGVRGGLHEQVATNDTVGHHAGPCGLSGVGGVTARAVDAVVRAGRVAVARGAGGGLVTRAALSRQRRRDPRHPTLLRVDDVQIGRRSVHGLRRRERPLRPKPGRGRIHRRGAVAGVAERSTVGSGVMNGVGSHKARRMALGTCRVRVYVGHRPVGHARVACQTFRISLVRECKTREREQHRDRETYDREVPDTP